MSLGIVAEYRRALRQLVKQYRKSLGEAGPDVETMSEGDLLIERDRLQELYIRKSPVGVA